MSADDGLAAWDAAVSVPTLLGSMLSMFATATVILLWTFARGKKRRDFRYALILNLTVAEFINSLNNSISGIVVVSLRRPPTPGIACNINGWTGQFSVTAVDFSILAITIVTLLTIQLRSSIIYASTLTKALICLAIWIVPLCTSIIAWIKSYYGPVSGNWCWIEKRYTNQRYILNHGWRFAIFVISLCTYAFVFVYMVRRFRPQNLSTVTASSLDSFEQELDSRKGYEAVLARCTNPPSYPLDQVHTNSAPKKSGNMPGWDVSFSFSKGLQLDMKESALHGPEIPHQSMDTHIESLVFSNKEFAVVSEDSPSELPRRPTAELLYGKAKRSPLTIDREVWRMLLLNMYPVTYLILWIPGIANRVVEGVGHDVRALVILQSSTQFIGFANAVVYLYQEHGKDCRKMWDRIRTRQSWGHEVLSDVQLAAPQRRPRRWTSITM
ncbi:hypothetical protein T440DRAFT_73655 [Plenodomus tracheiphilus IPT5]|uniref:G-protein coupled receptors family 1 profile domain-containing protein n=1 Tax=Plenodomus tracheiphilus IPT5 TaxID=1408161 RepID=A0A6A7B6A2_9PLEO|nr:hypothetical protein T440DRAFT_73655 [Plenodomus tracheiphilus IPT5]